MNRMAPLQGSADQLAQYGRYGDSMLVHMNPAEVRGIAALSPTGSLTRNPVTGQPEAFLPFLAPLLAKAVPAVLAKAGLGGLASAAAAAPGITSAITSGLVTGVAEGDLEKGIMAGITSFGIGKALGAAGDVVGTARVDEATKALDVAKEGLGTQATPTLGDALIRSTPDVAQGKALEMGLTPLSPEQTRFIKAAGQLEGAEKALIADRLDPAKQIGSMFSEEGLEAFGTEMMKPSNILPTAIGAGNLAQMDAMERQNAIGRDLEAKRQRMLDRQRGIMSGAASVAQPRNPFAGVFNKPGLSAFSRTV